MLVIVIAVVWPFFRITFFDALAVPWTWLPNERLVGETVTLCPNKGRAKRARQAGTKFLKYRSANFTGILGERNQLQDCGARYCGVLLAGHRRKSQWGRAF